MAQLEEQPTYKNYIGLTAPSIRTCVCFFQGWYVPIANKYLKYGVLRKMQMAEILINEYHIWMIVHCFHSDACVAASHQDSLNQAG